MTRLMRFLARCRTSYLFDRAFGWSREAALVRCVQRREKYVYPPHVRRRMKGEQHTYV